MNMIGRLHGDIFNQEAYLLDMTKVRLRLHCRKNPFCLMCSEINLSFQVKLLHISSNAYLGITSALNEDTAKYPVRHVVIKSYSISAGSISSSVDYVFRDVILQRFSIEIVHNDASSGTFGKTR